MSQKIFKASAAAVALAATISVATPVASAQNIGAGSSQIGAGSALGMSHDQVWNTRNELHEKISQLNSPAVAPGLHSVVDGAMNALFPHLIAQKEEESRQAAERARIAAQQAARRAADEARRKEFDYGACPMEARVCVDLDGHRSWVQGPDGRVQYLVNRISSGKPGQETPRGTFPVVRKVRHERSIPFNNAPMPYSIYFTNYGHAFHEGSPYIDSAGCVHLAHQDAVYYWNNVQVGDTVVIY